MAEKKEQKKKKGKKPLLRGREGYSREQGLEADKKAAGLLFGLTSVEFEGVGRVTY